MNCLKVLVIALATFAQAQAATLQQWSIDTKMSHIYFTSIKKGSIAEVHHFKDIQGTIDRAGQAEISINLSSAETNIAIRNERLATYLFESDKFPSATINTQISPKTIHQLRTGETLNLSTNLKISLHGHIKTQPAQLTINKLENNQLMVSSAQPIIINASDYGLTDGINKLRDLAGLPSIGYAVPVTFTLRLNTQ